MSLCHFAPKTKLHSAAIVAYEQDASATMTLNGGDNTINLGGSVTHTFDGRSTTSYRWIVGRAKGDLDIQVQKVTGAYTMGGNAVNTWMRCDASTLSWSLAKGVHGTVKTCTGYIRFRSNSTQQEILSANVAWSLTAENTATTTGTGCPTCCFTPDTLITMADGSTKRIVDVQVGDLILTTDGSTAVTEIITREYRVMYEFSFADGRVLNASEDHPLYVSGKGFACVNPTVEYKNLGVAAKIAVGDRVVDQDGKDNEILSITEIAYPWEVYTFAESKFYANGLLVY